MLDIAASAGPFLAAIAVALTARQWREVRRRGALNEALHELRRPLQALALADSGPGPGRHEAATSWLGLATAALGHLEGEINGTPPPLRRERLDPEPVLAAALERWRGRAVAAGAALELRSAASGAAVIADRQALSRALDNLIANAIEHGGKRIALVARCDRGRLRIEVTDSGGQPAIGARLSPISRLPGRLTGRSTRGHGLRVVRRIATAHGGRCTFTRLPGRSRAMLELPAVRDGSAEGT